MFEYDFLTVDMLTTPIGLAVAVSLLTQFTKDLIDRFKKIRTKYIVYFYAEVLMFIGLILTRDVSAFSWREWLGQIVIILLNGMIVALASMKSYEEFVNYILNKQAASLKSKIRDLEKGGN